MTGGLTVDLTTGGPKVGQRAVYIG